MWQPKKGGNTVILTSDAIYEITVALVEWLVNKYGGDLLRLKIAVGHDSRITSEDISEIVKLAIVKSGINVVDCSLSSTPAMFMTTVSIQDPVMAMKLESNIVGGNDTVLSVLNDLFSKFDLLSIS